MVQCLLSVYELCTQFLVYVQSSFWYYSQHPTFIASSFSSSKFKLIFSKYILNFPFNSSCMYPYYCLCCMWDETHCVMVTAFCNVWLLHQGNHCNVSEILQPFFIFIYMLLISCVIILRPSSPNSFSTTPGTSSPVAFLSLISLIVF